MTSKKPHPTPRTDLAAGLLRRPLLACSVLFAGGIYAASSGVYPAWAWLLLAAFALLTAVLLPRLIMARLASIAMAAIAAGALVWLARNHHPPGDPISRLVDVDGLPLDCSVEGVVRLQHLENQDPAYVSCVIAADTITLGSKRISAGGGVLVRCTNPPFVVHAGDRIKATGKISARFGYPNFGISSTEAYWGRQGVFTRLNVKTSRQPPALERLAQAPSWSARSLMSRLRKAEADRLQRIMPPDALPFVLEVWLGYRAPVSRSEYQDYVKAGVAHILSVSGIHTSILFITIGFLLRLFVKNKRAWALATMAAILLFALTTGVRPAALRSAIMIVMVLAAHLSSREPDPPSALAASAIALLAWNPDTLFDIGFQLSFLSLGSILMFESPLEPILPLPGIVRKPLSSSIAVQVLPLPIAVSSFHVFPIAGILLNLLVIPLSAAVLWLTFLSLLISLVSIQAATVFGHAAAPLCWVIKHMVSAVAAQHWTWLRVTSPTPPATVALWAAAFCAIAFSITWRTQWAKAAALLTILTFAAWRLDMPRPHVDFLALHNGDSIVVTSPRGNVMLIDGGDADEVESNGEDYVAPFLWAHHIRRIDYVVATHADRDHLGGLFYILENFRVGEVWMPQGADKTPLEQRFEAVCRECRVPIRRVVAGDSAKLDTLDIRVLHPPAGWPKEQSANESSIVMTVQHEDTRLLLTGDIEKTGEQLVSALDCRANIIKAPHHGSATSSSPEIVQAVAPSHCVITCAGTSSARVSPQVLHTYAAAGCTIWRTDILGGIRVNLDPKNLSIQSVRTPPQ